MTDQNLDPTINQLDNQTGEPTEPADAGQLKGWPEKLQSDEQKLHAYKSIQGAYTGVTTQNKELKQQVEEANRKIERLEEQVNAGGGGFGGNLTFKPGEAGQTGEGTFDPYDENAFNARVGQTVATMRIAEVLEDESNSNPQEFHERYAVVRDLSQQYPNLTQSPAGVRKLFQMADKRRQETAKTQAHRALGLILGRDPTDEDIQRFRQSFPGAQGSSNAGEGNVNAGAMPDSTSSARTGQDTTQTPDFDARIEEAKKRGDLDEVTRLTIEKQLAETGGP